MMEDQIKTIEELSEEEPFIKLFLATPYDSPDRYRFDSYVSFGSGGYAKDDRKGFLIQNPANKWVGIYNQLKINDGTIKESIEVMIDHDSFRELYESDSKPPIIFARFLKKNRINFKPSFYLNQKFVSQEDFASGVEQDGIKKYQKYKDFANGVRSI